MPTQIQNRTFTNDVDVMVLHPSAYSELYRIFKGAVRFVAQDEKLSPAWLSTNIGDFLRTAGPLPEMKLWKKFGSLHIYIPPKDFILAHKLVAGREKDTPDIEALCHQLHIHKRAQVQKILDRYINPDTQSYHKVETTLDDIFD